MSKQRRQWSPEVIARAEKLAQEELAQKKMERETERRRRSTVSDAALEAASRLTDAEKADIDSWRLPDAMERQLLRDVFTPAIEAERRRGEELLVEAEAQLRAERTSASIADRLSGYAAANHAKRICFGGDALREDVFGLHGGPETTHGD